MQKITLEDYKRILSLNEVDMFDLKSSNPILKQYIEEHHRDEELQAILNNTLKFISRLLVVLKNQSPVDEENIAYNFELPLNSVNEISTESDIPADKLFYLEESENQKISAKLMEYIFGKHSYIFFSYLEDKITYKDYPLYIPVLNIIVPASKVLELSKAQSLNFN